MSKWLWAVIGVILVLLVVGVLWSWFFANLIVEGLEGGIESILGG